MKPSLANMDVIHYGQILLATTCLFVVVRTGSTADTTLRQATVVCRHGDRSPSDGYPNDPYGPHAWPQGYGQLTQHGMRQMYDVGQYLSSRYMPNLLNTTYIREQIYVRSSDMDRTLMSALTLLAGLYPPSGHQIWSPTRLPTWQPVPIHTVPRNQDLLLRVWVPCPLYEKLYQEILQSEIVKQYELDNKELFEYVAVHSGIPNVNIDTIWYVWDTINVQLSHNMSQPAWLTQPVWDMMQDVGINWHLKLLYYTRDMARMRGGMLLSDIVHHMTSYITNHSSTHNMYLYMTHDTNLAALMSALGVYNGVEVPLDSLVIVELHELTAHNYHVKVLYHNESDTPPQELLVPGCDSVLCPVETFTDELRDVLYDTSRDWYSQCDTSRHHTSSGTPTTLTALEIIVISVTCALLLVIVLVLVKVYRTSRQLQTGSYQVVP